MSIYPVRICTETEDGKAKEFSLVQPVLAKQLLVPPVSLFPHGQRRYRGHTIALVSKLLYSANACKPRAVEVLLRGCILEDNGSVSHIRLLWVADGLGRE